jgi:hypothetical protein
MTPDRARTRTASKLLASTLAATLTAASVSPLMATGSTPRAGDAIGGSKPTKRAEASCFVGKDPTDVMVCMIFRDRLKDDGWTCEDVPNGVRCKFP